MKNKRLLNLILGITFIAIGCWKMYERYIKLSDVSVFEMVAAVFLILLGGYRVYQYSQPSKQQ